MSSNESPRRKIQIKYSEVLLILSIYKKDPDK